MAQKTPAIHLGLGMNGTWNSLWFLSSTEFQSNWRTSLLLHYLIGAYFKTKRRLMYNASVLQNQHQVFVNAQTLALMKWPRKRWRKKAKMKFKKQSRRHLSIRERRSRRLRYWRRTQVKLPFRFTLRRNVKFFLKRKRRWWPQARTSMLSQPKRLLLSARRSLHRLLPVRLLSRRRIQRRLYRLRQLFRRRLVKYKGLAREFQSKRYIIKQQRRRWRVLRRFWRLAKKHRRLSNRRWAVVPRRFFSRTASLKLWLLSRRLGGQQRRLRVKLKLSQRYLQVCSSLSRREWQFYVKKKTKFLRRTRFTRLHKFKRLSLLPKKRAYFRTRRVNAAFSEDDPLGLRLLDQGFERQLAARAARESKAHKFNNKSNKWNRHQQSGRSFDRSGGRRRQQQKRLVREVIKKKTARARILPAPRPVVCPPAVIRSTVGAVSRVWLNAQIQSPLLGYNRLLVNLWRRDWKTLSRLRVYRRRRKKLRRRLRRWRYYRQLLQWLPLLGGQRSRVTRQQRLKLGRRPRWKRPTLGSALQLLKARRLRRFKKHHQALRPLKTLRLLTVAARNLTGFPTYLTVRRYLARPGWIKFIKHRALFARWKNKVYCVPTLVVVAVALMRASSQLLVAWLVRLLPVFKQHSPLLHLVNEACKYFLTHGSAKLFRQYMLCQGVRCEVIGKVNGNDRASTFRFQYGAIPTSTLRAGLDMEFGVCGTLYGVLGVAVWFFMRPAARRRPFLAKTMRCDTFTVSNFVRGMNRRNQGRRGPRVKGEPEKDTAKSSEQLSEID